MIKKYRCPWCEHNFEKEVRYVTGQGTGKTGGSSQVKCPGCCNLIPTWKKELTGNIVGRKHIHIR